MALVVMEPLRRLSAHSVLLGDMDPIDRGRRWNRGHGRRRDPEYSKGGGVEAPGRRVGRDGAAKRGKR